MKLLFLSILATAILFSFSFAYGHTIPMTTQEVLDEFDMILLGTVTNVKTIEGKAPVFTIDIEDIVKKPNSFVTSKTVLAFGCNPNSGIAGIQCPSYEVGQRGLFLLVSSKNNYEVSSYSQVAEPHCTSEQFLANYKGWEYGIFWKQDGQSETLFTGKPIDIHYTVNNRDMKEKDYSVMLSAHSNKFTFSDVINGTVSECTGSKVVTASFVPPIMGTYGTNAIYDEGSFGSFGISIIDYDSTPLEQYKAGIHGQDTWCKDGLILVLKKDDTSNLIFDNKPACVKPYTVSKLAERNVIELASFYNNRPLIERLYAGMTILQFSEIPITTMGLYEQDQILGIMIDEDELGKNPNTKDYFDRVIRETIPFNVPLKITFGKYWGG